MGRAFGMVRGFGLLLLTALFVGCASTGTDAVTQVHLDDTAVLTSATAQVQAPKTQPPKTHYQAALAELKAGNTEKASIEVKLALQDNPLDASSHFLFGCLLASKGEHDLAIVAFQARWHSTRATQMHSTTWERCCFGGES
jgi:Tfp pilus assembly protein PilF